MSMEYLINDYAFENAKIVGIKSLIICVFVFMLLDIITGLIGAIIKRNLNSSNLREGLLKKLLEAFIILIGFLFDYILSVNAICMVCSLFIIVQEVISILENIGEYVKIPEILRKVLDKLQSSFEEKKGE